MKLKIIGNHRVINTPFFDILPDSQIVTEIDAKGRHKTYFLGFPHSKYQDKVNDKFVSGTYFIHSREPLSQAKPEAIGGWIHPSRKILVPNENSIQWGHLHALSCITDEGRWFIAEQGYAPDGTVYTGNKGEGYQRICLERLDGTRELILEHWQSEATVKQPGLTMHPITGDPIPLQHPSGVQGIGSPQIIGDSIISDSMFYNRFLDLRAQNYDPALAEYGGYPPEIVQRTRPTMAENLMAGSATICQAERIGWNIGSYRWVKYYDGEPGTNLDTALTDFHTIFPKIHWNRDHERYIGVSNTSIAHSESGQRGSMILFSAESVSDTFVLEYHLPITGYYPTLIDKDTNSTTVIGKHALLVYGMPWSMNPPRFHLAMVDVEVIR